MKTWQKIIGALAIIYIISIGYVFYFYATKEQTIDLMPEPIESVNSKPAIVTENPKIEYDVLAEPKIAKLPDSSYSLTNKEIIERVEEQGTTFCETLTNSDKQSCIEYYWSWRAEKEGNPDLCNMVTQPGFVRQCKQKAATVAVALVYYEESEDLTKDIVPSNIELCDKIEYEDDKEYCLNPKLAFDKNKFDVVYKVG